MEYFLLSAFNIVLFVLVGTIRWIYSHFFEFVNFVLLLWVLASLRAMRRRVAPPATVGAEDIRSLNDALIERIGRQSESIEQTSLGVRTLQEQNFLFSDSLSKTLEYLEKLIQLRR